jgi:hypothetical protein
MSSRQERISLSVSCAEGRVEDFAAGGFEVGDFAAEDFAAEDFTVEDFAVEDFAAEAGDLRTRDNTDVDRDFPFILALYRRLRISPEPKTMLAMWG